MTDTLAIRSDHLSPTIGAAWIKANLLGALANAAAQLGAYALSPIVTIGTPDAGARFTAYLVAVTAIVALGSVFGAFLTGRVLQQKLPAFRIRYWIALFALYGLAAGALTAVSLPMSGSLAGEPDIGTSAIIADAVAIIVYAAMGAAIGTVQAMILLHAARGLGAWIAFSALSGTTWILLFLTVFHGPGTGLAQQIASVTALFAIAVVSSFIMLPALHRLRPR